MVYGVAERKNRYVFDVTCTITFQMSVPKYLWSDVVLTASYLINKMSFSVLFGDIPFRRLCPYDTLFHLLSCVFDCICYVQNLSIGLDKLSRHSIKYVFTRYSRTQKGYRCYNLETHRYLVSIDVSFSESTLFFSSSSPINPLVMISLPTSVDTVRIESVVSVPTITVDRSLQVYTRHH